MRFFLVPLTVLALLACSNENLDPKRTTEGPAVTSSTATSLSIKASAEVTTRSGVVGWEVVHPEEGVIDVVGLGATGTKRMHFIFAQRGEGGSEITDGLTGALMLLDDSGTPVGEKLSPDTLAALDSLSLDASTLKDGGKPAAAGGSGQPIQQALDVDLRRCTRCYGVLQLCGDLVIEDGGGAQCTNLTRCGWCIGWWR
ncbi:MAG: hypothetical protein KA712_00555 [Myxococcales bacterium]|nr:hypothetical protein [Myxococcales bacterium]